MTARIFAGLVVLGVGAWALAGCKSRNSEALSDWVDRHDQLAQVIASFEKDIARKLPDPSMRPELSNHAMEGYSLWVLSNQDGQRDFVRRSILKAIRRHGVREVHVTYCETWLSYDGRVVKCYPEGSSNVARKELLRVDGTTEVHYFQEMFEPSAPNETKPQIN